MVKPVFRRKSIGTKVSEEEYAQLEALAGGRAMSEWARAGSRRLSDRAGARCCGSRPSHLSDYMNSLAAGLATRWKKKGKSVR
jgi:hypothetical protein